MNKFWGQCHFDGELPDSLDMSTFDKVLEEKGPEWVAGYLDAMQVVAVNIANIVNPPELLEQPTKQKIYSNIIKYWTHNRDFLNWALEHRLEQALPSNAPPSP